MLSVGMFWNLWTEFLHWMKWWRENMEAIRKYIDADNLITVMKLPGKFRNRKLEVIIFLAEEQEEVPKRTADIDRALQLLTGAIPYTGYVVRRTERGTPKKV